MRSDHLTKHAKRHPEFNFDEFSEAKKRLDDLVGLEQVDLNSLSSPSEHQQQQQKSKIFLPTIDNSNYNNHVIISEINVSNAARLLSWKPKGVVNKFDKS